MKHNRNYKLLSPGVTSATAHTSKPISHWVGLAFALWAMPGFNCQESDAYDNSQNGSQTEEALAKAMIAHYPMDTDASNQMRTGNNGVVEGEAVFLPEGHLELDGDDDSIRLGDVATDSALQLAHGGTIAAWFKQRPGDPYQRIIDKSNGPSGADGYTISANPSEGKLILCVEKNCYFSSVGAYALNEWTHFAAVIDPGTQSGSVSYRLYINGVPISANLVNNARFVLPPNKEAPISIGSWNHAAGREFNGFLDDIRVYGTVLTPEGIEELQAEGRSLPKAMIAHYPMDTDASNQMRTGNNGVVEGEAVFLPEGHLELDGDDDSIRLGDVATDSALQLAHGGTIAAWFKQRPGDPYQRIIDKSYGPSGADGYTISANPSEGKLILCVDKNCYFSDAGAYALNEWTHFAAVIDPGTQSGSVSYRLYINGVPISANLGNNARFVLPPNKKVPISIGSWNHAENREFNGFLDDIRIYNTVLTPNEIEELHTKGRSLPKGMIAHYPMDTDASNQLGTENNGVVEGGATFVPGGVFDGHLQLDGNDDVIRLGDVASDSPLQLTDGGTIVAWFRQLPGDDYQRIVDKSYGPNGSDGYTLIAHASDQRLFLCIQKNCYISGVGAYLLNEWTHVAAVIDPGAENESVSYRLYVNGVLVSASLGRNAQFVLPPVKKVPMSIGSWNHAESREFNGLLDDIRIYNTVMGAENIKADYERENQLTPVDSKDCENGESDAVCGCMPRACRDDECGRVDNGCQSFMNCGACEPDPKPNQSIDEDGDGVPKHEDCNDHDAQSTTRHNDQDCDGVPTAGDCNDLDPISSLKSLDGDCDGIPQSLDCNDADPTSTTRSQDGDCDGFVKLLDCDDSDTQSTHRVAQEEGADKDCDGVITAEDCLDTDRHRSHNCDPYPADWTAKHFGGANENVGPEDDFDQDGVKNIDEYQQGMNPTVPYTDTPAHVFRLRISQSAR